MTRIVRTGLALGALALVVASLSAWPAAAGQGTSFYVDCTFSPADAVLRVRIHDEEGLVRRLGNRIRVLAPTGGERPAYEAIDCGGTPTVNNTDVIRMRIDSEAHTSTTGLLSLRRGPFAPGTPESGVPEIEVLTYARHSSDELLVEGTRQDDRFRAGGLSGSGWVNLNPNAERASPDADLRLPSAGRPTVGFTTRRGHDIVNLNGGPEFNRPLGAKRVGLILGRGADRYRGRNPRAAIFAGRGPDTVVTGRHTDLVIGDRGNDSIRTRGARDGVLAVGGSDRVWTGRGNDFVYAEDGRLDRVNCGAGSDRASLDAVDRARSCEKTGGVMSSAHRPLPVRGILSTRDLAALHQPKLGSSLRLNFAR